MHERASWLWTDKDGVTDIVSNYNMLTLECKLHGGKKRTELEDRNRKWRLRD